MKKTAGLKAGARLAISAFCLMAAAHGQAQVPGKMPMLTPVLEGDYSLLASTTAPVGTWIYTKGRLAIKKLDDRHLMITLACEWKREPKAVCSESWTAQWRDGSLYLQDMNTFNIRMYFDPASRALTMISRGSDAKGTVRRDVFSPDDKALTDPALVRRMRRELSNFQSPESIRVFGPYSKRAYSDARIEFQKQ